MRKLNLILVLLAVISIGAAPSRPYNYVAQTTIDPNQNNTNVDISNSAAISASKINLLGSITNADVSPTAAIAYSKLNLSDSIVNADINSAAAIVDTKLATISTAGKVSGAALTSLSSIPSGAGVVPTANLGSGSATSSTFLAGDQTYKAITDVNTSNVLFQYSAAVSNVGTGIGEVSSTDRNLTTGGDYRYLQYRFNGIGIGGTVWATKWRKVAGVSTVNVYAQVWVQTGSPTTTGQVRVDIGGLNQTASGSAGQTSPEWVNLSIDVSSLTNGTVYDVTVDIGHGVTNALLSSYLGNLIAFGS